MVTKQSQVEGGRKAAARNLRNKDGTYRESPTADPIDVGQELQKKLAPVVTGHFKSAPPTIVVAACRPFPQISGHVAHLDMCINHLEQVAVNLGLSVDVIMSNVTIGDYQPDKQQIRIHHDLYENRPLYAFTLAHELAHALDPQYVTDPGAYNDKRRVRTGCEIVADSSAIRILGSFGLACEPPDGFLRTQSIRWRSKLARMSNRYHTASLPLLNPNVSAEEITQRQVTYNKASKWAYKEALVARRERERKFRM